MKGTSKVTKEARKTPQHPPKKTAAKAERLEARVSPEAKRICLQAANIQGRSLTDFVMHNAVLAATRIIRESELIELSRRDRIAFIEAVLNPPAPNTRLRKAMQRHDRMVGR